MAGPEPLPKAAVHAFSLFRHLSDGLRCYLSLVLPDSRNKQRALTVRQKRIITLQMCRVLLLCPHRDSRKALMALMNRLYALSVRGVTLISRPKYLFQFTVKHMLSLSRSDCREPAGRLSSRSPSTRERSKPQELCLKPKDVTFEIKCIHSLWKSSFSV